MPAPSRTDPAGESAEAMFRASFDDAPVGMAVVQPDGTWVRVNNALAEFLGYPRHELEGHSFQEFTHPEDRPLRSWFDDAVRAGTSPATALEKRYLTADGRTVWAAVTSSLVHDDGRSPFVISHIRDITERRARDEDERERARRADVLVRLSDALARRFTADVDALLDTVVHELVAELGEFSTVLLACEDDHEVLELRGVHHRNPAGAAFLRDVVAQQPMRAGEGIAGRVYATGEPFIVAAVDTDAIRSHIRPDLTPMVDHFGAESVVVVPLRTGGSTIGVLSLGRTAAHGRPFGDEDIAFLETVAERVAMAIDNTRLYQALRASEERVRLLHQNAPLGLAAISEDGRFMQVNPALCALLGRTEEELVGSFVTTVVAPEDERENVRQWRSLVRGELAADRYEMRYLRKDGTPVWARVHATVVRDADGRFDHLLAQTIDVSERRRVQGLLTAVFDSVPDLLSITGFDGSLRAVNPAWTQVLGWEADELSGMSFFDLLHPDDVARTIGMFDDDAGVGAAVQFENRVRTKAGDYRWLQWNAVVLPEDEVGVASARDVTEQRERAEELRQSNADLSQFASVAAHDLKSPLAVIAGFADLLLHNQAVAADEMAADSVEHIRDGSHRLLTLVDDLLDYSRIGAGPVPRHPVDLGAVARTAVDDLARDLADRKAIVELGDLPEVLGDAGQLRQLLQNLISNGTKFVSSATVPRVRVSAERGDGGWTVSVADNGIGIASGERDEVFGMFHRLAGAAGYEGTGIGLAICRRVVERHGGSIWFEDNEPSGTVVRFTIGDAAR